MIALALIGCAGWEGVPPALGVSGPDGPVASATFVVTAHDEGAGLDRIEVSVDGGDWQPLEVPAEGTLEWSPALPDGSHALVFAAVDRAWTPNRSVVPYEVRVDSTPPVLEVAQRSTEAAQGRTWALWVRADEPLTEVTAEAVLRDHTGEDVPWTARLWPMGDAFRALRGMEIQQAPGPVDVTVRGTDEVGNVGSVTVEVQVRETEFEEGGFIRLSKKQTKARTDRPAIERMRKERNEAYATELPEQRWSGAWVSPVDDSEVTSPFGKYRTYSDGRKSYHSGLDLDQDRGAPVMSAAPGTVLVANEQAIFGNVVIVNHGHGVASSYNHLDSIAVEIGDEVGAGTMVGTLGSTGQSTGPHLHWGVEVGVVAVNPTDWLASGFDEPPFAE